MAYCGAHGYKSAEKPFDPFFYNLIFYLTDTFVHSLNYHVSAVVSLLYSDSTLRAEPRRHCYESEAVVGIEAPGIHWYIY